MRAPFISIVAMAALVAACETQLTAVTPANLSATTPAFGYYLPREMYQVTVTYVLTSCPDALANPRVPLAITQSGVTVTAIDVADPNEHYYLTYRSMDSDWKNTTFQASLYSNQTLKSVGAAVSSQVTQSLADFASTGLNAAKLAGTAYGGANVATCRPEILQALNAVKATNSFLTAFPPTTTAGGANRSDYSTLASSNNALLTQQVTVIWNPNDIGRTTPFTFYPTQLQVNKWFTGNLDQLFAALSGSEDQISTSVVLGPKPSLPSPPAAKPSGNPIAGVVYRDPLPTLLKVCQGKTCSTPSLFGPVDPTATVTPPAPAPAATGGSAAAAPAPAPATAPPAANNTEIMLLTQPVSVPQVGPYIVVPLKNGWLDNNNFGISFAANGVPCALAYGTQSRIYQLSQSLNTASSAGGGGSSGGGGGSGSGGGSTGGSSSGGGSGSGGGKGGGGSQSAGSPSTPTINIPSC
jgi:hypothetical protein